MRPVVAAHHQLVRPRDEFEIIRVVELLRNVLPEGIASASRRNAPPAAIVRVRPKQVADGPFVGHLLHAVQLPDLVQSVDARRQPSMQTEDLAFDDSGEGEVVEEFGELLPDVGVAVLAQALVVESIHLSNLPALVVPSQDSYPIAISDLQRNQQSHRLH